MGFFKALSYAQTHETESQVFQLVETFTGVRSPQKSTIFGTQKLLAIFRALNYAQTLTIRPFFVF